MRNWLTAQELAGKPGLPGTVPGVRKVAVRENWHSQKRAGTKAIEYAFSDLPAETQAALLSQAVAAVTEGTHAPIPAELPALTEARPVSSSAAKLNARQKAVMTARLAFIREIERLSAVVSQKAAIAILVKHAQEGQLSPYLQQRVQLANDRKTAERGLSERTLKRWLAAWRAAGQDEAALAPIRQRASLEVPEWLPSFLRCYQRPTKPSVAASYAEFASSWDKQTPSIHVVQRFLKKLSPDALNMGRMSPQELKSLQAFRRRSTESLFPGDVYTADGHKFDAEVVNPLTGKPYRPEITTVLDVATRRVVGISVGESESAFGVLDALRDAVRECMFAVFYVDNGSGFDNEVIREVVDRLGGTMQHSLPYNSQARGLSERGHQTIWVRAAKKLTSYIGADMDKHVATKVHRLGRRDLKEHGKSRLLPEFGVFMAGVEHEIAHYNSAPHRGLGRIRDPETGVSRHMSPDEAWSAAIEEGWSPIAAPADLVESLMRPQAIRTTRRGEVSWAGNNYFMADLTALHGQEIRIAYDVRDASRVWTYTLDGELIGPAKLDGNSSDYMPRTMMEIARDKRQQGQLNRAVNKVETLTGHRVEMIAPNVSPSANLPVEALEAARDYAAAIVHAQPKFNIPGDDVARYRLWVQLEKRKTAGEELTADEAKWHERYPSHPDFVAMKQVFQQQAG
ncbi:Mu transposase C-terminal domain-containing protein [Pseudomonas sp. NPDC089554]|uniref:Mu transposase C-terminal domain-containing protein n=1 Tax=Pseudomonas sp. NPDC089554 TaxID=3390653 RepID=UPI003D07481A